MIAQIRSPHTDAQIADANATGCLGIEQFLEQFSTFFSTHFGQYLSATSGEGTTKTIHGLEGFKSVDEDAGQGFVAFEGGGGDGRFLEKKIGRWMSNPALDLGLSRRGDEYNQTQYLVADAHDGRF